MIWLVLSLVSSLLLGAYDAAKKWSVRENAVPMVLLCSVAIGASLYLPVVLWTRAGGTVFGQVVKALTWSEHGLIFAKSLLVGSSWTLAFSALKHLPLSVAAPIRATSPLWTILIALFFFQERPTFVQWLGIGIVLAGFWRFTLVGRSEGIRFGRNRSVALMVGATLLGACSSIYDKWLLQHAGLEPTTLQAWFTIYLVPVTVPLAVWWYRWGRQEHPFRWRRSIALVSPLLIAADWFYFTALADPQAMVSIVSVIRRSSVIIALAFGVGALSEGNLRAKSICVGIILVGVMLLTWHAVNETVFTVVGPAYATELINRPLPRILSPRFDAWHECHERPMSEFLLYYKRPDPTTWVYLSSFLTIGLFFVFHRFWSVRNLDVALLILLAPGLLMVHEGRRRHLREMESGAIAETQPIETDGSVLVTTAYEATDDGGDVPATDDGRPIITEPSIQEETNVPLVANPEALDERLEEIAFDPDTNESAAEVSAKQLQKNGFVLLFIVEMLILVRLMIDPMMNRRPLLDPNLKIGGLYFISISLFIFMMANVATSTPRTRVWQGPELGPGYALMHKLPTITTRPVSNALAGAEPATEDELDLAQKSRTLLAKILVISAHVAIVVGIVLIANRHFGNLHAGVGCATLYLMLPYTAQMTGRVDHAVPAAMLLWAVLNYRRPMLAGLFIGLAAGLVYYPLFLLPLWCSFYWQRGVRRFAVGVAATLVFLMVLLSLGGTDTLIDHLRRMFGLFQPTMEPRGIWGLGWSPVWRLPVIVAFAILSFFFAAWPSPKNLGALIGCSAAVMVAAQFWHGYGGGLYIAWFLPLLLLTIFRPNLQDRIALKVVDRRQAGSLSGRIQSM